jgi:hypothetical protein
MILLKRSSTPCLKCLMVCSFVFLYLYLFLSLFCNKFHILCAAQNFHEARNLFRVRATLLLTVSQSVFVSSPSDHCILLANNVLGGTSKP